MTEATRQSLSEQFQLLNDRELLAQFRSDELTELAKSVAGEELHRRGIDALKQDDQPPDGQPGSSGEDDLVPIARLLTAAEAEMLKTRLEIQGVPAIVADAQAAQTLTLMTLAVGGVRVLVPESYVDRALEIVKGIENGDYALKSEANPP